MTSGADTTRPLWQGVVAVRLITAAFAVGVILVNRDGYDRPDLGLTVLLAICAWTAAVGVAYSCEAGRRIGMIGLDLVVTIGLMACSVPVLSTAQLVVATERIPLLTTVWASGPVLAAAVRAGGAGGVLTGAVVSVANWAVRGYFGVDIARDTVLLLAAGLVLGMAATSARLAGEQLRRAARAEAAAAERERLARSIHDGVLQLLARMRHRGAELGGEAAELGRLASEQEVALRALTSSTPPETGGTGQADLASALRVLADSRVEVSVPATPVSLPAADVDELVAVVTEALANTERHAQAGTRAWVLVEDLDDEVVLSVRDDGPGIGDGRLLEAETNGRQGIARSIRGRVADLGATLSLDTRPGRGTEWEVRLSRRPAGQR